MPRRLNRPERRRPRREPPGVPMTPMIDIIFQLIAFFVVALHQEAFRPQPSIRPPLGPRPAETERPGGQLTVEVDSAGRLFTDAGPIDPADPEYDRRLDRLHSEAGEPGRVVVRADEGTAYAHLDRLFRWCRSKGMTDIGLRLREELP